MEVIFCVLLCIQLIREFLQFGVDCILFLLDCSLVCGVRGLTGGVDVVSVSVFVILVLVL